MSIPKKLVIVLFLGALLFSCNMDAQEKAEFFKKEADEQRVKAEQMEIMAKRAQLEVEKVMKAASILEMKALKAIEELKECKNGN